MADRGIALFAGEIKVNRGTLLLRQIHPNFIKGGRVTSQAFQPFSGANKWLSVYDGDQITAGAAWHHYVLELNRASVGVMAVSAAECCDQKLRPKHDPDPFPEHAVIEFNDLSSNGIKKAAKKLAEFADKRDWQHKPMECT